MMHIGTFQLYWTLYITFSCIVVIGFIHRLLILKNYTKTSPKQGKLTAVHVTFWGKNKKIYIPRYTIPFIIGIIFFHFAVVEPIQYYIDQPQPTKTPITTETDIEESVSYKAYISNQGSLLKFVIMQSYFAIFHTIMWVLPILLLLCLIIGSLLIWQYGVDEETQ